MMSDKATRFEGDKSYFYQTYILVMNYAKTEH